MTIAKNCYLESIYLYFLGTYSEQRFPGVLVVKNLPANAGDAGDSSLIPGLGRFLGEGNGSPLQYSCLKNSMDRGTWWATSHGFAKSWTQLSTHTHAVI